MRWHIRPAEEEFSSFLHVGQLSQEEKLFKRLNISRGSSGQRAACSNGAPARGGGLILVYHWSPTVGYRPDQFYSYLFYTGK